MRGILKHDMYSGIYCLFSKILTFGLIFFIAGVMAINQARLYDIRELSFFENMLYIFFGCKPFIEAAVDGEAFHMPIIWMVIQLYLAYIIGSYPTNDMKQHGINLLIRTKSRVKWWLGKVVWVFTITTVMYALSYLIILILSSIFGGDILSVRAEAAILYGADLSVYDKGELVIMIFLLPVLTAFSVSLLQMMLMFVFNEVVAYGTVGFMCVASAFYNTPFFILNNSMVSRTMNMFIDNSYIHVIIGILILIAVSILIGAFRIRRKNIYEN